MSSDSKVRVVPADWLKPGWLLALTKTGCEATRFDTPRGNTLSFSKSILGKMEAIRLSSDVNAVFLSSDDCALISEHFPDLFYKSQNQ